ncbi:MAG: hypothetical protein COB09_18665 [Thalassobium sp.]|nr:MAG: hypothetical protein COB09_18665 [Thalassobium sp.]
MASIIKQINLIKFSTMEAGEKIVSLHNVLNTINIEKMGTDNAAKFESLCGIASLAKKCIRELSQ